MRRRHKAKGKFGRECNFLIDLYRLEILQRLLRFVEPDASSLDVRVAKPAPA